MVKSYTVKDLKVKLYVLRIPYNWGTWNYTVTFCFLCRFSVHSECWFTSEMDVYIISLENDCSELYATFMNELKNPRSLKRLCRTTLRDVLKQKLPYWNSVHKLPLPQALKKFIAYANVWWWPVGVLCRWLKNNLRHGVSEWISSYPFNIWFDGCNETGGFLMFSRFSWYWGMMLLLGLVHRL